MNSFVVKNIRKKYGDRVVLDDVSFCARRGEVLGLLGTNGAGKTTLMKLIAGLAKADRGTLEILDENPVQKRSFIRARLALVPQNNNLERECTVFEALWLYARLFGVNHAKGRVAEILDEFAMTKWRTQVIEHLSGGMARRVLIARAMLVNPDILLLDEPSVGLDPDTRQEIWQMILQLKEKGKTILLTTHYMDEAEFLCDRVAFLKDGRLLRMDTVEALTKCGNGDSKSIRLEEAFFHFMRQEAMA